LKDNGGDQEAGDDEKYIDADKSALHMSWKRMEGNDRENGDGPEAVNIGTIRWMGVPKRRSSDRRRRDELKHHVIWNYRRD